MAESVAARLRRLSERLVKTTDQIEAHELHRESTDRGATAIGDLADRELATVSGTVRAVTLRPRTNVPALVVELYDGTDSLSLIWLGRRKIRGIEPGSHLQASGRVCHNNGIPTIFNPAYELLPRSED